MLLPRENQTFNAMFKVKTLVMASVIAASGATLAATQISQVNKDTTENTSFQTTLKASGVSANSLSQQVSSFLNTQEALSFRDITPDHVLARFKHLQQTYNDQDVEGARIVVQLDNQGRIQRVFGSVYDGIAADLNKNIQKSATAVVSLHTADEASSEQANVWIENYLADMSPGQWTVSQPLVKPVVHIVDGQAQSVIRLSFNAENRDAGLYLRPLLFVNPDSGDIVDAQDTLHRSVQAGRGPGGNEMTSQYTYSPVNSELDALSAQTFLVDRNGDRCTMALSPSGTWKNNVVVMDGPDATAAYWYRCNSDGGIKPGENTYLNGAFAPLNDAAFHAQVAFNLYERFTLTQWQGPLKSSDPLIVKANYGATDNASWNGQFIALGNGDVDFYPKVSADIIGHELAHAVLDRYSQINQSAGISMGIAESFADIAGEATEYAIRQTQSRTNDWKYGAEVFKPTLDAAARYFTQPSLDGKSIDSAKDWNVEVTGHHLAGPMNKAFYHLVNDNDDWTPLIAYDLWITAAANCWSYSMQYVDAAQCMLSVADTFRSNSELPDSVSLQDVRRAVILAFAKAEIYLAVTDDLVALFDYERVFSDIRLINKTSSQSFRTVAYRWDTNNDGSIDQTTHSKNDTLLLTPQEGSESLTIALTADDSSRTDTYVRELDLTPDYCTPSGFGGTTDYIKQVSVNGVSFPQTQTQPGGYADYTNLPPLSLLTSGENTITLTPNDNDYRRRWTLYVDLNGDHDFDDAGEQLYNARSKGVVNASFTLPEIDAAARDQITRLRVVMDWSNMERPCAHATSGEYEDYAVRLSYQTDPTPDPVAAFTPNVPSTGLTATFTNNSTDEPENVAWSWRYRATGGGSFVDFANTRHASLTVTEAGRYDIELLMFDNATLVSTAQQTVTINGDDSGGNDDYCQAGSATGGIAIKKVAVHHAGFENVLVNATDANVSSGYTLFDASLIKRTITQPANFYISVEVSHAFNGFDRHVGIWLDKNKDKVFADDELVFLDSIAQKERQYANIVLSSGEIEAGETRIRVFAKARANPSACETVNDVQYNGEVEDYLLRFE